MAPRVSVRQGDITSYDGDAIVNAANNRLQLGGGVAGSIRRAGGPDIQRECDRHGPIQVGEAALTGGGDLPAKWVIHAAAMGDKPISEHSIRASTLASLHLATGHGLKRIAFPVLGAGIGGFELRRSAEIMVDVILTSPHASTIDEIVFFGFLPRDVAVLEEVVMG